MPKISHLSAPDDSPAPARRVLDTDAAARYLSLAPITLRKMRWLGEGPEFVKLSRARVGYAIADLDAWLASRPRYQSTAAHKTARRIAAAPQLPDAA